MLYDKIIILCGKNGISLSRLERDTGLRTGTIRCWKEHVPNRESLSAVASYFGVNADELSFTASV